MSTVKKAFAPIIAILEANMGATVADVFEQVKAECVGATRRGSDPIYYFNAEGDVIAIQDYYLQKWLDPRVVEFGAKASSPTKLSNMCKESATHYNKQRKEFEKSGDAILKMVVAGEITPDQIPEKQKEAEAARDAVIPREDGYGFDTFAELVADSEARGLDCTLPEEQAEA